MFSCCITWQVFAKALIMNPCWSNKKKPSASFKNPAESILHLSGGLSFFFAKMSTKKNFIVKFPSTRINAALGTDLRPQKKKKKKMKIWERENFAIFKYFLEQRNGGFGSLHGGDTKG